MKRYIYNKEFKNIYIVPKWIKLSTYGKAHIYYNREGEKTIIGLSEDEYKDISYEEYCTLSLCDEIKIVSEF